MALTEAEFDRIEAYLDGNLPPDEHRQLEAEMAGDPDLQQAVEEHRVIWEGLQVPVAVEYFQEMHGQLEEQGLLQDDDLWVEASMPDETSAEHTTAHRPNDDEPEVFVTEEPKANLDDTTPHIEVEVHDEPVIHVDPELDDKPDGWDGPTDTDLPDIHYDDPDEY